MRISSRNDAGVAYTVERVPSNRYPLATLSAKWFLKSLYHFPYEMSLGFRIEEYPAPGYGVWGCSVFTLEDT